MHRIDSAEEQGDRWMETHVMSKIPKLQEATSCLLRERSGIQSL